MPLFRKQPKQQQIVSDDLGVGMSMDEWDAAVERDKKKKKRVSGVVIGAALCCLPGATLGSIYDDWRASKEAPEMEARLRAREEARERAPSARASALPWGDETYAIMGTQSIQEIVADVNGGAVVNGVAATPVVGIPVPTVLARAA